MPLVAGVDSSTQSCKVVIRDAETGALVRQGRAPHPDGTEVDPRAWWDALLAAVEAAGGLADVAAVSVAGQQHGMVCLDGSGEVVRPALLWNDTRSADAARDLITEAGGGETGRRFWADAVGLVPVASFTATKLRWLARHEPAQAARVAAVCLPHDWLTWRLAGAPGLAALRTDRGDASGTGYWSPRPGSTAPTCCGRSAVSGTDAPRGCPAVLGAGGRPAAADDAAGAGRGHLLGPGTGDNAGAALGVGARSGRRRRLDRHLRRGLRGGGQPGRRRRWHGGRLRRRHRPVPAAGLHAQRGPGARLGGALLGVDLDELSELALSAPPGADGLVMVPYLEGERTPDRPTATGSVHGLHPAHRPPRPTWPGRRWRGCSARWPTASTRWWPRARLSGG